MKKVIVGVTIVVFIASLVMLVLSVKKQNDVQPTQNTAIAAKPTITIKGKTFILEIADSPEEHIIGLSNRQNLPQDTGMLFIFDSAGTQAFWMKDTFIPLDMIFINSDKIVTIHKNVPAPAPIVPDMQLPRYAPTEPANLVLEVNAGVSDQYGFVTGDTVEIKGL